MADISINDSIKTLAVTSSVACGPTDLAYVTAALLTVDALKPAITLANGILTLTLTDGRVLYCTLNGASFNVVFGSSAATSYTLTAAGNANGVYTGTVSVTANSLKGLRCVMAGFSTGANNGAFVITANNGSTTITTTNTSSASETHAGTASLSTLTADLWAATDLKNILTLVRACASAISAYTATVFTVTYA